MRCLPKKAVHLLQPLSSQFLHYANEEGFIAEGREKRRRSHRQPPLHHRIPLFQLRKREVGREIARGGGRGLQFMPEPPPHCSSSLLLSSEVEEKGGEARVGHPSPLPLNRFLQFGQYRERERDRERGRERRRGETKVRERRESVRGRGTYRFLHA